MIKISVFSEEKAWSKRLKNNNLFFKKVCKLFPKKYQFLNKKVSLNLMLSNNKNINKEKILKEYGVGAQILIDLGIKKITLLTKSRKNIVGIDGFGLEVNGTKRF